MITNNTFVPIHVHWTNQERIIMIQLMQNTLLYFFKDVHMFSLFDV